MVSKKLAKNSLL